MDTSKKTERTASRVESICWGYEAENGPSVWGQLKPEYGICGCGAQQSPIDIVAATPAKLPTLTFSYQSAPVNIQNTGRTIQVVCPEGSWMAVDGKTYSLVQFHFHAPSEHTVDGKLSDMELHLVHEGADGSLAVVGVLIEAGNVNPAFTPFWEHLPATPGDLEPLSGVSLNPRVLLPEEKSTYRYTGSLTTPPCSEGVLWFLMTTPVEMSHSQIAAFKAIMYGNNRPPQPRNGRELLVDADEQRAFTPQ